jgi:hypothetical protein
MWMEGKAATHAVISEPSFLVCDCIKECGGKILAPEQQADVILVEAGVIQEGEENVFSDIVQQSRNLFLRCRPRALAINLE